MFSLTMLLVLVGLSAGVLAGLFGIGGGLVIVPALTFLLLELGWSVDQVLPTAIATSLASMLLTSFGAVWAHHQKIGLDHKTLWQMAPGVMVGAVGGAWLATTLPALWVAGVFTALVSMIGLRMLLAISPTQTKHPAKPRGAYLAGPLMGAASSLVGIGGGSLVVPYLIWNGYRPVSAVALASAIGWLLALAGTVGFLFVGPQYLHFGHVLVIGLAGLVAAPLGVALAHRLSPTRLRRLFGLMLVLVACRMLWQIYTSTQLHGHGQW